MVPFQTIPPSDSFGWKDFFDSLRYLRMQVAALSTLGSGTAYALLTMVAVRIL